MNLKWGYDAGFVYYTMTTTKVTLAAAALAATNNGASVWATIHGASDKYFSFGCDITIAAATTYTGVWSFYAIKDSAGAVNDGATTWALQANTVHADTLKALSDASTATVFGTAVTLAADKVVSNQTILAGSTMNIASDRLSIECMTKIKYV